MHRYQFFGLLAAIFMVAQEINHDLMPFIAAILFGILCAIFYLVDEVEDVQK